MAEGHIDNRPSGGYQRRCGAPHVRRPHGHGAGKPEKIYIIEFKYGGTPEKALAQIDDNKYALQFENSLNPKPVVKVGVNISPDTRTIDAWTVAVDNA